MPSLLISESRSGSFRRRMGQKDPLYRWLDASGWLRDAKDVNICVYLFIQDCLTNKLAKGDCLSNCLLCSAALGLEGRL